MQELSTEQKIISAAREMFTKKGFAATRTRDIAEEAGINLALLNYYFGSKEKLFRIIMEEQVKEMLGNIGPLLAQTDISLNEKVINIVDTYTDLLLINPDLPIFVLNELKSNDHFFQQTVENAYLIAHPVIDKQITEQGYTLSTIDFIMNIMSLTIFPFISKPLYLSSTIISDEEFKQFVLNRKEEIPAWIDKISK